MKIIARLVIAAAFALAASGLYATGNLRVNLAPSDAVKAGAKWQVDSGNWQSSGATVKLTAGSHVVGFKTIAGWIAPASTPTTVVNGSTTTLTETYIQTATLSVTISPGSAQWRIDGGTWQASGATVVNLAPGDHLIDYSAVAGYQTPASETVTLTAGEAGTLQRSYVQYAHLTIALAPTNAQWRVDGGSWLASGTTVSTLLPGTHTIDYTNVTGYITPASETVSITGGQSVSLQRTYVQLAQLSITLTPTSGQWRVNGGAWQTSGAALYLTAGSYTVDYAPLPGYAAPASETIALNVGQSLAVSRNYIQLAQLSVTLSPATAQWRVDGGAWQASGATVVDLMPGSHTVDYTTVSGYITPASEAVALSEGQLTSLQRTYIQLAQLSVALTPNAGQWRVNSGAWQTSGTSLYLTAGTYTVDYAPLSGYTAPTSESVTLTAGQTLTLSRSYIQLAQLTVTLTPATAQWRVDGSAWQPSGTTVANLAPGNHTIDYAPVAGYQTPPSETIALTAGQAGSLQRSYVQYAQLTISLDPTTALWRIDGGAWLASGTTLSTLLPGIHSIDYSDVTGYITPASETLSLTGGQSLPLQRTYVQLAQLSVTVSPSSGQWRVNGGSWQASGTSLYLTAGTYTVDYAPVSGYTAPSSESVTLTAGQTLPLSRSYIQLAQLTVTLTPSTAQWRVDAGAWQASGTNIADLAPGSHTVDYSDVSGYLTPASETVTLSSGQSLPLQRTYLQPAQLTITLTPSSGQWRIDGGAWQPSGATVANLVPGDHFVDYSSIPNYDAPPSETVSLTSAESLPLSRSYTPHPATVSVTLTPGGAQWEIDPEGAAPSGTWHNSGDTVSGISAGDYTITYSTIVAYTAPAVETVTLSPGQSLSVSRSYTPMGPAYSVIHGFQDAGEFAVMFAGSDKALYVATQANGSFGGGQIIRINADGSGYTIIKAFGDAPYDLTGPTSMFESADGAIYGTAGSGGSSANNGGVFKINKDGSGYSILHVFGLASDGASPSTLLQTPNGTLYGTTQIGGTTTNDGVVFTMKSDGTGFTVLHTFNSPTDGSKPCGLTLASNGILYGTTTNGGVYGYGTLFSLNGGAFSTLRSFNGLDGVTPHSGVIQATDGLLYGTTIRGGTNNYGVIYRVSLDGSGYTVLLNAAASGGALFASLLTEGPDGAMYGTAGGGGTYNHGAIYRINKDGSNYTALYNFTGSTIDGGAPVQPVVFGPDGALYGANRGFGGDTWGVVYRVTADGTTFNELFSLGAPNGFSPIGSVSEGSNGILYGTTFAGGGAKDGTVYLVNRDGTGFTVVHHFSGAGDGMYPFSAPRQASDGMVYGTTNGGNAVGSTLYRFNPDGTGYTVLKTFTPTDANGIEAGVIEGSDGALYGTASGGGATGLGTVFRINKDGTAFTILHNFTGGSTDGEYPYTAVIEGIDGALYGTTNDGGSANFGTVFKVNKDGSGYAILHVFGGGADGASDSDGLYQASNGRIYGMTDAGGTSNLGTIFMLSPDGSSYATIRSFTGGATDGASPQYSGFSEVNGVLYAVTCNGGVNGVGILYSINLDGTSFTILNSFDSSADGAIVPTGTLARDANNILYGTAAHGAGGGAVFRFRLN